MIESLLNFSDEFEDLSRSEAHDINEDLGPVILHRKANMEERSYNDLFDRAREIYSRGRRRYTRRASGIV